MQFFIPTKSEVFSAKRAAQSSCSVAPPSAARRHEDAKKRMHQQGSQHAVISLASTRPVVAVLVPEASASSRDSQIVPEMTEIIVKCT
jgi:hypothetical protein